VTAIVAGSAALLAIGTSRVHEWVVMTDELLYAKLARHTAETGSPLPVLHGNHVGFLGVVYPLVLSPFYGAFDAPGAFGATHIVNAVLFASAAIPAYLLTRRLAGTPCALVVSLLSVAVPWCVNAAFVMSEPAAYPMFLWAVLACHAAVSEPSARRDALAVGAMAVAFFTRPQFLFLAAVLPIAVLIADGARGAWRRHRPLAIIYAVAILIVVPLAALGESHRLLGDYGVTATKGSLLPLIALKSAAIHVDVLAVGLGVVPFLLGAGWAYSRLRDADRRRRAFAAVTGLSLPLLALETASYDVRFGGSGVVRDRYLFYLAPLLILSSALCLMDERLPVPGIAGATAFFSVTVCFASFAPVAGLWVDSPESVLNGALHDASGPLPTGVFVGVCGLVLGAVCVGLALWSRPAAIIAVTIAIFAFGGSVAGYAFERLLTSNTPQGIPVTGQPRVRNWVDRSAHRTVALLAYPVSRVWGQSAILWWDVEFWNNRVQQAFVDPDGTWTYTPFPAKSLRLDFEHGVFDDTKNSPPFVLAAENDSRFGVKGEAKTSNLGLVLLKTERPYRVSWASRGLEPDGWTQPGRPATVRIYGKPGAATVEARLDAPPEATAPTTYRLGHATGAVNPGTRATVRTTVCISQQGHEDLTLETGRSATVDGPPIGPEPGPSRAIGLVLSGVDVTSTRKPC
jgi:hypothetical protein